MIRVHERVLPQIFGYRAIPNWPLVTFMPIFNNSGCPIWGSIKWFIVGSNVKKGGQNEVF